jgi:hypothetical protein
MLATVGKLLALVFRVLLLPAHLIVWLQEAITGERRRLEEQRSKMEQRPALSDDAFVAEAGVTANDIPLVRATRTALARACLLPETAFYPTDALSLVSRLMTPGPNPHWLDLGPDWLEVLSDIVLAMGLRASLTELEPLFDRWRKTEGQEEVLLRDLVHWLVDFIRECRARRLPRAGQVSLWVGRFGSSDKAEAFFAEGSDGEGIKPSIFAREWGLGFYPPHCLEIHFEQTSDLPLAALLQEATFSASFIDAAVAAATRQGIGEAQGIALLYDFDYQSRPGSLGVVGPMRFIGTFAFDRGALQAKFHTLAEKAGSSVTAVLFVLAAFGECRRQRHEQGQAGHVSAAQFCEYLVKAGAADTAAILRCLPSRFAAELPARETPARLLCRLGLPRSDDVGRVVFGLVNAGVLTCQESESEADFHGLFLLE